MGVSAPCRLACEMMSVMPHAAYPVDLPAGVRLAVTIMGSAARASILHHLAKQRMSAPRLATLVPISHASVIRHLAALERMGLVHADRPAGHRLGRGLATTWTTAPQAVEDLASAWTEYVTATG